MGAHVRQIVVVALAGVVAGCGGGGHGGSAPVVPPPVAPVVHVVFPPANALTDQSDVGVRGIASDPDGVASVTVDGLLAQTANSFAEWSTTLPVVNGDQSFVVDAVDAVGNASSPAAGPSLVRRGGPLLTYVTGLAFDGSTHRLRAISPPTNSLLDLNPATGQGYTLSNNSDVGNGLALGNPYGVASDPISGSIYVTSGFGRIAHVDPASGDRTIVSGPVTGSGPAYNAPNGIKLTSSGLTAYVSNAGAASVLAVSLVTGDRTTVSGSGVGTGPALDTSIYGLALDEAGGRVFVTSALTATMISIALPTGNRTIVSGAGVGGGPTLGYPIDVVHDAAANRLYVVDSGGARILAVDLATGDRSELSGPTKGTGPTIGLPRSLASDFAAGRIFVADSMFAGVLAIDVASGNRTIAYRPSIGSGPGLYGIQAHAMDLPHGRILAGLQGGSTLVAIDATTGDRTPFGTLGEPLSSPIDVIVDEAGDRALVIDTLNGGRVLSVGLATGISTVISGDGVGTGTAFGALRKGTLDVAGNRLLAVDESVMTLVAVDLTTGARSTISGAGVGLGPVMGQPVSVTMDADGAHALVCDYATSQLLRIELATGNRTVVSSNLVGGGTQMLPSYALCLSPDQLHVWGSDPGRIVSFDLATGFRAVVTESLSYPHTGKGPFTTDVIYSLTSDPTGQVLWYGDYSGAALFAVDVATGERVIVSR